jgi:hypothetical protein
VLVTIALVALGVGIFLILALPVSLGIRLGGCGAWLAISLRELLRLCRSFRQCRGIRIDGEGLVEVATASGHWRPAQLMPGSIVLRRLAWLRVRQDCGLEHAELLIGSARENEDWRRLQVIWRHLPHLGTAD